MALWEEKTPLVPPAKYQGRCGKRQPKHTEKRDPNLIRNSCPEEDWSGGRNWMRIFSGSSESEGFPAATAPFTAPSGYPGRRGAAERCRIARAQLDQN
jgi:hypothetical protein